MTWIPLHVHSQYSILDALSPVSVIVSRAKEMGLPAVALTDHGNLHGVVDFCKECRKAEIRPIVGCELYEAPRSRHEKTRIAGTRNFHSLLLLAKDDRGYHNLCKLSSLGYTEGFYYRPRVDRELLEQYREGLICLSGDNTSRLALAAAEGGKEALVEEVKWYQNLFGEDFYLELQRHPMTDDDLHEDGMYRESWLFQKYQEYITRQEQINALFIEVSKDMGVPLVATNDSHYMERDDWQAHEILLNVQSGEPCEIWENDAMGNPKVRIPNPKRHTYPSHELYFKTPDQMEQLFSDVPEALSVTEEIAARCNVELDFKTKHYPVFVPPHLEGKTFTVEERQVASEDFLRKLCEEGIPKRYTPERLAKVQEKYPDSNPMDVIRERLQTELDVIVPKGMCDYLLIVWDFIHWAKSQGIPVGPGRGSGAGSIVLYLIGITDIEPLRFNLFFERFINPERLSYPDIDVDICMERRGEVINYTLQKYGQDNVAQIITFGTMKAKMTIKDVGRVLSVPLAKVNQIAKFVPDELNITLDKALETDPDLLRMYNEDEDARRIIDIGKKLEGSIRNTGIHAAGIIVAGEPLTNNIPICTSKDSDMPVTQFSMKPVESVGMLKIDFLGLKTLTSIQKCLEAIKIRYDVDIDVGNLPLEDEKAFHLLNRGKTLGVFQVESGGMQDLSRQLHLDRFEEIIAVLSLYRPGPMDMIPSFIRRKHGQEPIEYDHPWMENILSETYGIMVYQEQVMQLAVKLANYSLGEGDVLRRAMGKKDMAQMAKEREKFQTGALDNDIPERTAESVFDKMEKFAAYGFNKSHAAAYGFITYVTAFLKANYPGEWLAALMTCDRDDLTKVAKFIGEAQSMDIPMLSPDVNESGATFVATEQGIRFAMTGIKGVGEGVVEAIIEERERRGLFKDFYDFFQRIDAKKVGKKTIENLVDAGAFDFTGWTRDEMRLSVEGMYDAAVKEKKDDAVGMMSLFTLMGEDNKTQFAEPPKVVAPSSRLELLLKERELLGFFLTDHPLSMFEEILKRLSCRPLSEIAEMESGTVFRAAFIIDDFNVRISQRNGKKFAILMISDGDVHLELPIWANLYEEKGELIRDNQLLYAVLQLEERDGERRLNCSWIDDLTRVNEEMVKQCDDAFDRAKLQIARFSHVKKSKEEAKEEVPTPPEKVSIKLDGKMPLSSVLKLKELLIEHHGETELELQFCYDDIPVAELHLDSTQRVDLGGKFKTNVESVPGVLACST